MVSAKELQILSLGFNSLAILFKYLNQFNIGNSKIHVNFFSNKIPLF